MNRRLRFAALPLLLLAAGAAPLAAQDAPPETPKAPPELPPAAPRAPLPPEPKEAGKKEVQRILREWFKNEPRIPVKGKSEAEVKGERARLTGELETEVLKWKDCLRLVSLWKARLDETQPAENRPTGIKAKEEFTYNQKLYNFAVSVPATYRGKGTDLLPVIITVVDKDADVKKLLPATYGKLLDTHIVVASYENNVPNAGVMLNAIYYAYLNFRCDRERFTLDGLGKGARFVEDLACAEYATTQWNGAVIRNPLARQVLEKNLGLFPVAVVEPAGPMTEAVKTAVAAHMESGAPSVQVPAGDPAPILDFIAGLPPRKAGDQKKPYEVHFKSLGRMPKWGYWFLVDQAVDASADQLVRVKIDRDPAHNAVDIDATNLAEGTLLLNDEVVDLDQPVIVRVNGIVVAKEKVARSIKHTFSWDGGYGTLHIGARNYFVTAVLPFVVPDGDARIPKKDRDAAADAEKKAAEDKKKAEEADRAAAEAAKKEAEAPKEPDPAPAPDTAPPPAPTEMIYFGSIDEARASKRGRPVLVIFKSPSSDARQLALEVALASEEVKKGMAAVDVLLVPPAEAGDAGKAARELLAELSGKGDTVPPFLALLGGKGTLSLVGLKDEDIAAAILKLLSGPAPAELPAPAPPKPTVIQWKDTYEEALKVAKESGSSIAVLFIGAADAKGAKELEAALKDDAECTGHLSRMTCVRLGTSGDAGARNLELQKRLDASRTPPLLCVVKLGKTDKGETTESTADSVDPVNLLADEKTFLAKVRAQLAAVSGVAVVVKPGETPPPSRPPAEAPAEPKPADPKPVDPPKPADAK